MRFTLHEQLNDKHYASRLFQLQRRHPELKMKKSFKTKHTKSNLSMSDVFPKYVCLFVLFFTRQRRSKSEGYVFVYVVFGR